MKGSLNIPYVQEEIRENMQISSYQDGSIRYFFENEIGNIQSTVYTPFPGVSLVQKEVHIPSFITNWRYGPVEAFVMEYCTEGQLECQVDEECLCISSGDIIIFRTDPNVRILSYPSNYYCAISFTIFLDKTYPVLEHYIHQANFSLERLVQTYLPDNRYFHVLTNKDVLKKVFESMYDSPKTMQNIYFGLKILESLLFIASEIPEIGKSQYSKVSKISVEMAKKVYDYVMEHPEERYTIEDLAKEFSISATQLKKNFQMVYGMPIQTFIREQKMKAAAKLLETSDIQITKIAQMFGYKNISKFAAAFEQVMGETPKKYSLRYNSILDKTE